MAAEELGFQLMMQDMSKKVSSEVMTQAPESKKEEIRYPSFYCDRELPLTEKDVGKIIMAMCKLKVCSVEKRADKSGIHESHSFDVMGMDLNPKTKNHYAKE